MLVTWSITPADQIRLRLEHEVSQLNFLDFAASAELTEGRVVAGAVDLRPDQTTTAEAAYERRFWDDGVLTLTASYGWITDAIDLVPVLLDDGTILPAVGNVGDGASAAFVVDTTIPTDRFRIPGGKLRLRGSWVEIDIEDPLTGETRRPSGNSPFIPLIGWTQDLQRWRTNWGFEWRWAYFYDNFRISETTRTELTDVISAFAEYKPKPSLSLRVQLNAIGTQDTERVVFDGPRDREPLLFVERRRLEPETRINFRIRQTF
jgi:outer membrane receptor protein involved in Fe transport